MLNKRTNVLLNQTDYVQLSQIAQQKNTTVSRLIRHAVRKTFKLQKGEQRQAVLNEIQEITKNLKTNGLNYRELIEDGRKY